MTPPIGQEIGSPGGGVNGSGVIHVIVDSGTISAIQSGTWQVETVDAAGHIQPAGDVPARAINTTLVRPDGRAYPTGTHLAANTATNANVVVVAAPGAGNHILVAMATLTATGAAICQMIGTIGGVTDPLANLTIAGGIPLAIPSGGLLMDANTAINAFSNSAGITAEVIIVYDIVT